MPSSKIMSSGADNRIQSALIMHDKEYLYGPVGESKNLPSTIRAWYGSALRAAMSASSSVQARTSRFDAMRACVVLLGSALHPRCIANRMSTYTPHHDKLLFQLSLQDSV